MFLNKSRFLDISRKRLSYWHIEVQIPTLTKPGWYHRHRLAMFGEQTLALGLSRR